MHEGNVQSVLRCGQCNKPFDKESTLKRHGYYCRSQRSGNVTRSRSCIGCAKRKARCDNRRPGCSRCISKGVECHYPANRPRKIGTSIQQRDDASYEWRNTAPLPVSDYPNKEHGQESSSNGAGALDTTPVVSDPVFPTLGGECPEWSDLNIDFTEFLNSQVNDEIFPYSSVGSTTLVRQSTSSAEQAAQIQQAIFSAGQSIPITPSSNPRSLVQRSKMEAGTRKSANLLLHTLKSYPLMMTRQSTLPPFVHPCLTSSGVDDNHVEPLNNCISLMHMIGSGVRGSRKLFWKNVRQECEHFCAVHREMDAWELLAAMQALCIYIILRVDEGETDHNNFDYLLTKTVTVLAKQSASIDVTLNTQSKLDGFNLQRRWKDWIFEESCRRICVVYQVMNMLVYFEPAALCDMHTELLLAPLPAKKQLWEANNEFVWKMESEKQHGVQMAFGLTANGDLVEIGESQPRCSDAVMLYKSVYATNRFERTANWEEWCSGMDEFGGLVMLAASLTA